MVLLYIADDGFSFHDGQYYYTRANHINTLQFGKYFSKVIYVARNNKYTEGSIAVPENSEVTLFNKFDFYGILNFLKTNKDNYDVVLLRNGMNGCICVNTLRNLKKPIISYLGYDALSYKLSQRKPFSFIEGIIWYFLEKNKMLKGTYAHYCADYLVKRYPSSVPYLVCPNVEINIDETVLINRKQKYACPCNEKIIGMIATLNYNKGIDTAIKSLSMLPSDYTLQIVGGGCKDKYVKLARKMNVEDREEFLGYLSSKEKINKWLQQIYIYSAQLERGDS